MRRAKNRTVGDRLGIPADYGTARGLRRQGEARRLAVVGRDALGRPIRLSPRAAAAWQRMRAAAARDGIMLLPLSGFRSIGRQARIIRDRLAQGDSLRSILRLIAAPGYSEHHTGRAIDIGAPEAEPLDVKFGRTAAFRWLRRNAGKFGFRMSFPRGNPHGIAYEPWHWCWRRGR